MIRDGILFESYVANTILCIEAKLEGMDLDALKKFIEDKGNGRKKDLYDACIFQTKDAEKTKILADKIQRELDLARSREEKFAGSLDKYDAEITEAQATIEEADKEIDNLRASQKTSSGADSGPHLARAKEIQEELNNIKGNKQNINVIVGNVNKTLQDNSPGTLVAGLEHFVAILRNSKTANNVDVELFFLDAKKLGTKLRRMEPSGLKYENITYHKEQLASIVDQFEDNPRPGKDEVNLGPFKPLIEWGIEFASGAEIILKDQKIQEDIAVQEAKKTRAKRVIERNETIKQDIADANMAEYYESQVKTLTERKLTIDKIKLQDQEQAVEYQKKLFNFEKTYFEKLLELVKNQE